MTTTVADALAAFRARHRMAISTELSPRIDVQIGFLQIPFPNPGYLLRHDLHHLALDVPPDFWGEVEVSVFELRTGTPTALIAFLCAGAVFLGALLAPRRIYRAWHRYEGTCNVYRDGVYAELLAMDLDELRTKMGLLHLT